MVVCPCIRSTDDGDHEIIFAEDGFRAQRGLEFIGVLRNPFHEFEGRRAADVVGSWLWLRRHVPSTSCGLGGERPTIKSGNYDRRNGVHRSICVAKIIAHECPNGSTATH